MWISRWSKNNSQFPLVDSDGWVGVCITRQLYIWTIQVPVPVESLDFYLWLIYIKAEKMSSGRGSDSFSGSHDMLMGACHDTD